MLPYDLVTVSTVSVSRRCRVTLDTNHYSVPPRYANTNLILKAYPDRLCLYHKDQLVAEHPRSYERHQDFEKPEHVQELLAQRRQARAQHLLTRFSAPPCPLQCSALSSPSAPARLLPAEDYCSVFCLLLCYCGALGWRGCCEHSGRLARRRWAGRGPRHLYKQ